MKIGFIGCGNMGTAMIQGMLQKGIFKKEEIIVSHLTAQGCEKSRQLLGVTATQNNREVVQKAQILVLAVKPQYYQETIREIREDIQTEHLVIAIAPGKTLAWLAEQFEKEVKLVRTMPNTPALVGEGMTGMCTNTLVSAQETAQVIQILESFGKVEQVPERLLDVVVSVSGSAPAYVFLMLEAMADGAVADGMPRQQAYQFAAQAVLGSAKMLLETGKHPGELKDMVCSPGGTTIEAVRCLERNGFRSSIIEAMKSCVKKSRSM